MMMMMIMPKVRGTCRIMRNAEEQQCMVLEPALMEQRADWLQSISWMLDDEHQQMRSMMDADKIE